MNVEQIIQFRSLSDTLRIAAMIADRKAEPAAEIITIRSIATVAPVKGGAK